jgi:hypothetical protein
VPFLPPRRKRLKKMVTAHVVFPARDGPQLVVRVNSPLTEMLLSNQRQIALIGNRDILTGCSSNFLRAEKQTRWRHGDRWRHAEAKNVMV